MFKCLEIETQSLCNRKCPSCLRNSTPDKDAVSSWFEKNQLPLETIAKIFEQVASMGHTGNVCLSHYNEPLMDERIVEIVKMSKGHGFKSTFFGSNGDFLTEELAAELDGVVDTIGFSLYMPDPERSRRKEWIKGLFKKTSITIGNGDHMITHYSPLCDVEVEAKKHCGRRCMRPQDRLIINHKGEMLLCCDDLIGHFDLGNINEKTAVELWNDEKRCKLVSALSKAGGRRIHEHCLSCPRN